MKTSKLYIYIFSIFQNRFTCPIEKYFRRELQSFHLKHVHVLFVLHVFSRVCNLRKATINLMSPCVRLSIRMEQFDSHLTDFQKI